MIVTYFQDSLQRTVSDSFVWLNMIYGSCRFTVNVSSVSDQTQQLNEWTQLWGLFEHVWVRNAATVVFKMSEFLCLKEFKMVSKIHKHQMYARPCWTHHMLANLRNILSLKLKHWFWFTCLIWMFNSGSLQRNTGLQFFLIFALSLRARSTSPWIWDPRRPEHCAAGSTNMKRVCAPRNSRGKTSSIPCANLLSKPDAFSVDKIKSG